MSGRLLYLLNVSNPDRLSADSGWRFAAVLLPALLDRDVRVTFCGPAPLPDPRAGFLEVTPPGNKYQARFGHDVTGTTRLVTEAHPDVVVVNQIEQAPAIRAALLAAGSRARLAGYCHYLPFHVEDGRLCVDPSLDDAGLGRPVVLHFLAGLLACDRVLVHSATAAEWIRQAAALCGMRPHARIEVVPPPRDPDLVREPVDERPGSTVAVYNHRLYDHYGTARFVEMATRLTETTPIRVRVTDLLGRRRRDRTSLDPSPERYRDQLADIPGVQVRTDGGDRRRYRELLQDADFAIAPFRPGCPWSMSVVDCQSLGVPVISPRLGWMSEHIDPELLFDEVEDGVKIAQRLTEDPLFRAEQSRRAFRSTAPLTASQVAGRYLTAVS